MSIIKRAKRSVFPGVSFGLALALFSITSNCGSPAVVHINVAGKDIMNEGYPALVCIYQLSSAANFENVPIESFWKDGEKAFAGDVVGSRQAFMLEPGKNRWEPVQVSKETKYLGVAVDFRRPDNTGGWRLVYDVSYKRPKELLLTVVGNKIEIQRKK